MDGNQFNNFQNVSNCLHERNANSKIWILSKADFKIIIVPTVNLASSSEQGGGIVFGRERNFDLVNIFDFIFYF